MDFLTNRSRLLVIALLAVSVLAGCGGAEERKAKYLERGKAYFEEENYEKATIEFKNVLQIDPKSAAPYYYLGWMAEKDKNWRLALGNYGKAIELDPEHIDARLRLGRFYVLAEMLDEAQEQADEVLAREPSSIDGRLISYSIQYRRGNDVEAIPAVEALVREAPDNEGAAILLANIYLDREQLDKAAATLQAALETIPDSTVLRLSLVQVLFKLDRNDEAVDIIKALVAEYPDKLEYRVSLVSFYLNIEQFDRAEEVLREAIAADPDDEQRYLMLANVIRNTQSMEAAIGEITEYSKRRPGMVALKFLLARLYVENEQYDEAEAVVQGIIQEQRLSPEGIRARAILASMKYDRGEYDEARNIIQEVLAENPSDSTALLVRGRIEINERQYADAIASFRSVLKGQPDSVQVLSLLAMAHDGNGDKALALEQLMRAAELAPADANVRMRLARMLAVNGEIDKALKNIDIALEISPDNLGLLRTKADILSKAGDTAALEEVLDQISRTSPETGIGDFGKGRLYMSQGRYEDAVTEFTKSLEHTQSSSAALGELVNIEIARGDPDAALDLVRKVLAEEPDNRVAHYLMAKAYAAKQDFPSAEQELLAQLEVTPENTAMYTEVASIRLHLKDIQGAEDILKQGLDVNTDSDRLLLGLAGLYQQTGQDDKVTGIYTRGMQLYPSDQRFVLGMGTWHQQRGEIDQALALYDRFLATNPDAQVIINNIAALLADHRTDDVSLARARELAGKLEDSGQPVLLDTAGWVHYRNGNYDKAAELLATVVEKEPDVPEFRYHLGMTYYRQGDMRAAREILAGAVAEEYSYPGVDEARKTYGELAGGQE